MTVGISSYFINFQHSHLILNPLYFSQWKWISFFINGEPATSFFIVLHHWCQLSLIMSISLEDGNSSYSCINSSTLPLNSKGGMHSANFGVCSWLKDLSPYIWQFCEVHLSGELNKSYRNTFIRCYHMGMTSLKKTSIVQATSSMKWISWKSRGPVMILIPLVYMWPTITTT